ncbi:hypothetical protein R1flu_027626 [Riccia fluitans]|uniref:Coenzyme Q-binding protein COQ10 START domain-containing protein n=1 Tax=Riccia fluitans TaxID=41844 RepID=A0ABD1XJB7_9MARC
MGEQNLNDAERVRGSGGAGEHQQEEKSEGRAAFASNRRTGGSAWSRAGSNSSWNVGSKDGWRNRSSRPAAVAASSVNRDSAQSRNGGKSDIGNSSQVGGEPRVHVQKGKDTFAVEGSVVTEAHPDALYSIITDFGNTAKVYRTVDRVEVDDQGPETIVKQYLRWSFLAWGGEYNVTLRMKPDPQTRTLFYNLDQQGFLKVFNGSWTVEPIAVEGKPTASKLILQQEVLPSFLPPGPLGTYAAKIMSGQVKTLLTDLAKEASAVTKAGQSP